jgi:hypothetical protein
MSPGEWQLAKAVDRNDEVIARILLQKALAEEVRLAVNRLRNYGITLQDVHAGVARELGRTSASLQDRKELVRMLADFARRTLDAYDLEREDLAVRAAVTPTRRRR